MTAEAKLAAIGHYNARIAAFRAIRNPTLADLKALALLKRARDAEWDDLDPRRQEPGPAR